MTLTSVKQNLLLTLLFSASKGAADKIKNALLTVRASAVRTAATDTQPSELH
jgi:hypothetical protein